MIKTEQQGFTILATLVLCLVLSIICLSSFQYSLSNSTQFRELIHSQTARLAAIKDLVTNKISTLSKDSSEMLEVQESSRSIGQATITRKLYLGRSRFNSSSPIGAITIRSMLSDLSTFPLLNYRQIFSNLNTCTRTIIIDPVGLTVSSNSIYSARSCIISRTTLNSNFITKANLLLNRKVTVNSSLDLILATAGYFNSTGELEVNGPVTIIAGGDLMINQLQTTSSAELVLISATGRVNVTSSSGPIKVQILANHVSSYPPTLSIADSGSLKFHLAALALGIN